MFGGDIGSAFVRIRPNTAGFRAETESGIKGAFGGIGKILGGALAVGGLADLGVHMASAAATQQASMVSIRKEVRDSGAAWVIHGKTVETVLEQMARKSGETVPELAQGFFRLEMGTHNTGKALKDLALAEDISIGRHLGLAQSALILTKAEQGNETAMRRIGIILPPVTQAVDALKKRHDEAAASGIKFTKGQQLEYKQMLEVAKAHDIQANRLNVLAVLQQKFGGQTAAFANTAAGHYAIFKESFRQLEVSIGNELLPALSSAGSHLAVWVQDLAASKSVHAAAASVVHDLAGGFHVLWQGIQLVGDVAVPVGKALYDVEQAIGLPTLLVAAAAYKSVGIGINLAAAAEKRWVAFLALGAGAKEAEISETAALTAANTGLAASIDALTVSLGGMSSAVVVVNGEMIPMAIELDAIGASAIGAATELDALGASIAVIGTEEAAVGVLSKVGASLMAIATGPAGIGLMLAGIAGGLYYLVSQESSVSRANDSLRQSFNQLRNSEDHLRGATDDLKGALSALPTAKIAVATAKIGVENAKAALGTGAHARAVLDLVSKYEKHRIGFGRLESEMTKVKGPVLFRQQVLSLLGALDELRTSQERVKQTEADAATARKKQHDALLEQYSAQGHEIARIKKLADAAATQEANRALHDVYAPGVGRGGPGTAAPGGAAQKAQFQAATQSAKEYAAVLNRDVTEGMKKNQPAVAAAISKLREFTLVTGKVPTKAEVKFILDPKNAKASLEAILTKLGGTVASAKVLAATGGTKIAHDLLAGIYVTIAADTKVQAALDSKITSVVAAVRHFTLGAHSPSTVTARELGLPAMQGIELMIDQRAPILKTKLSQAVTDAIVGGAQSVADAVGQAESNLNSIGSSIGSEIGSFIDQGVQNQMNHLDFGPLGNKIKALTAKITAGQQANQAAQNQISLNRAQMTLAQLEKGPTGGQSLPDWETALADQRQTVADAQRTIADQQLTVARDRLQKQLDNEKTHIQHVADLKKQAATRDIANLTDELNRRLITEGQFNARLGKLLGADGVTYAALGRRMGIAFADQFRAEMKGLALQERAILAGPRLPGATGFEPNIVRPIEAVRQAILQVEQAKTTRDKAILAELKKISKNTHRKGKGTTVSDAQATAIFRGRR